MSHSHDFKHQPYKEGFDGLGLKEQQSVDQDLAQTVYYTLTRCSDRNCPVREYRSWLFNRDSFTVCCNNVHPDEPSESMTSEFEDFQRENEPVTIKFTCRHCGATQSLESDHIYSRQY